jgi:hypothetical protein
MMKKNNNCSSPFLLVFLPPFTLLSLLVFLPPFTLLSTVPFQLPDTPEQKMVT